MDSTTKIPGYRIDKKIGEGGMATVYLATQESLTRTVALKIMAPTLMVDSTAEQRFLKEGRIVAQLNHPHIVTVYDIGHVESVYYMAMEHIEGGNLITRIQQGMSPETALSIIRQIAHALDYAHRKGFIHRDVKPANILFKEDGSAVLSDFGIAKAVTSHTNLTRIGYSIGTPDYMSPEQVTGKSLDPRSDLYSLGVVLYEMLTLQRPFKGEDAFAVALCHVNAPVPRLPKKLAPYQSIIDRLLAKTPEQRFATAAQFIDTLDDLRDRETQPPNASRTVPSTPRQKTQFRQINREKSISRGKKSLHPSKWAVLSAAVVIIGTSVVIWKMSTELDPHTQRITEVLIDQAERHMEASRLTEPAGNNAYQTYRYILEFDPDNRKALAGIKKIADYYEKQALDRKKEYRLEEGLEIIVRGLQIVPQHSGLLALQEEILEQQDKRRKKQEIARLLALAQRQIETYRYITPEGDNAYASYRQVQSIEPDNKKALQGLKKLVERIEQQAISERRKGWIERSLTTTEQGLKAFPGHTGLEQLRSELNRERSITELLTAAKAQMGESRLTMPAGNNALETYRSILILQPKNKTALQGLQNISKHYEKQAQHAQRNEHLHDALLAIGEGLKAVPNHPNLLALRTKINARISEIQNRESLLSELLTKARAQTAASQFTQPDNDNAYETYRKILAIDPDHQAATVGMTQIVQHLEQQARQEQRFGRYEQSLSFIEEGIKLQPQHPSLIDLRKEIMAQLEAQHRAKRIEELLTKARQQFAANQWMQPKGDNALESYQQVLILSPYEDRALSGIQDIAEGCLRLGQDEYQKGHLDESLAFIRQGLSLIPYHPQLLSLQQTVTRQMNSTPQETVRDLLAKAQKQLKAWRLTRPREDNAYQTYTKILQMEPGNPQAEAGLRQLANRYEILARNKQRADDLQGGLRMVELGLTVDPNHSGLLRMQEEIKRELQKPDHDLATDREIEQEPKKPGYDRANNIAQLLDAAQQQLEAEQYLHASDIYQQILNMDPKNALAKEGLKAIAGDYEKRAKQKYQKKDLKEGLSIVEEGLRLNPSHRGLLSLQKELARQLELLHVKPKNEPKKIKESTEPPVRFFGPGF
jgi:serine/threonine-protein kinase PpkA